MVNFMLNSYLLNICKPIKLGKKWNIKLLCSFSCTQEENFPPATRRSILVPHLKVWTTCMYEKKVYCSSEAFLREIRLETWERVAECWTLHLLLLLVVVSIACWAAFELPAPHARSAEKSGEMSAHWLLQQSGRVAPPTAGAGRFGVVFPREKKARAKSRGIFIIRRESESYVYKYCVR